MKAAMGVTQYLAEDPQKLDVAPFQHLAGWMTWVMYLVAVGGLVIGGFMLAMGMLTQDYRRRSMGGMMVLGSLLMAGMTAGIEAIVGPEKKPATDAAPSSPPAAPPSPKVTEHCVVGDSYCASTPSSVPPSTTAAPDGGAAISGGTVALIVGILAALVVLGIAIWFLVGKLRERAEAKHARARKIDEANRIWDGVRAEYDAFLVDPADVLWKRPLLYDVKEPLTIAFMEAREATADAFLDLRPGKDESVDAVLAAAKNARSTFDAAERHARAVGLGDLTPADRDKLATARKMLDRAMDPAVGFSERENCITRISETLASITTRSEHEVADTVRSKINRVLALSTAERLAITERAESARDDRKN